MVGALLLCSAANGAAEQSVRDFEALRDHVLVRAVSPENIKGTFAPVASESGTGVGSWVFDPPHRGLEYHPAGGRDKRGFFEVHGSRFHLGGREGASPEPALESLRVSEFDFGGHRYLCLESGGTGLYRSGTWQQVLFVNLFDVSNPKRVIHYPLYGRFIGCRSFGDPGDGSLVFLKIETASDAPASFRVVFLRLGRQGFRVAADRLGVPYGIRLHVASDGSLDILSSHLPRPPSIGR